MRLSSMVCAGIPAMVWLAVTAGPVTAATPPVACGKARSATDRAICASPEFVAMDREIAALYDRGRSLADPPTRRLMVDRRRAFLKARFGCAWAAHHSAHPGPAIEECLRTTMEARVSALRRFVENGGR